MGRICPGGDGFVNVYSLMTNMLSSFNTDTQAFVTSSLFFFRKDFRLLSVYFRHLGTFSFELVSAESEINVTVDAV